MKVNKILSIDYKAFSYFVNVIIWFIGLVFLIVLKVITGKYNDLPNNLYVPLYSILWMIHLLKLIIRIKIINNIIEHGTTERMEIFDSKNSRKNRCICLLFHNGQKIETTLRVSKKNKQKLDEYCKKGDKVNVGFLNNKLKEIIMIDVYKEL